MSNKLLEGKVAIVTGASSGMGRSAALQMAQEGAKVVLVSRTAAKLEAVAEEIKKAGGEAVVYAGDASKEETNRKMVEKAVETYGQLDVAFINAGSIANCKLTEVTEDHLDSMLGGNLKSVVWALKYVLPAMAKSPNQGSVIVNTSCMGATARIDFAGSSLYSATKAAADMLVKYGAIEAAEDGTRVNGIAPGIVATNILGMSEEQTNGFGSAKQLVGRAGRGEEVANFVTFLASDASSFMTGSTHLIDGGWSLKA